jgi:MFS family permease
MRTAVGGLSWVERDARMAVAVLAAVVAGVLGDAVGRRRTLVTLSGLMALAGIVLVVSESFPVLLIAAFVGNLSGFVGGAGQVRSNRLSWPSL